MADEKRTLTLSRRSILASMGALGAASALGGAGTLAYFNDTETFSGNGVTAGELDLKLDWLETYNGVVQESQPAGRTPAGWTGDANNSTFTRAELADNPGPVISLNDVKPGDEGEVTISLHVFDNPAHVWFGGLLTEDADNSISEPEDMADGVLDGADGTTGGDLADAIRARVWYDDDCDNQYEVEPVDIALVMDNSGSMFYDQYNGDPDNDGVTKLENAKLAASQFVDDAFTFASLTDPNVGVVRFGGTSNPVSTIQALTADESALVSAIQGLSAVGPNDTGTDLAGGIDAGHAMLTGSRPGVEDVMIVLSDGQQANVAGDPVAEATQAKAAGIRVITIALNPQFAGGDFTQTMADVASSPADAYVVNSSLDLPEVFSTILAGLDERLVSVGSLTEVLGFLSAGHYLDGDTSTDEPDCVPASRTKCLGFSWRLPKAVGNLVQTDSATFDLTFYAEQCRHNPEPQNPFAQLG